MTIETLLQRCVEGPARFWVPIMLILGISLVIILPATDEYNEARKNRIRLHEKVVNTQTEVTGLDTGRRRAEEKLARLAELEARTVGTASFAAGGTDQLHVFRQEIVELARRQKCQIRRIRVDSPRQRRWEKGDDPLATSTTSRHGRIPPPFVLSVQPMTLSVSGTLPNIENLLAELQATGRLTHTRNLAVYPTRQNQQEVTLDLELLLFDLKPAETTPG